MIITDLGELDPRMQPGVRRYLRRCEETGISTVVLETFRELSTQMAYYARGRAPVTLVRAYFQRCGLWVITDVGAGTVSTQTLDGKHVQRLAVDVAPAKDGRPWWDAPHSIWEAMFLIAETECGLDACASGKWQAWKWDWPHHEFRYEVAER